MSFRNKLLAVFSITIALVVALVAGIVSYSARRSFERTDQARTTALESQFRRDFDRRRHDAAEQVSAALGHQRQAGQRERHGGIDLLCSTAGCGDRKAAVG